MKKILYSFVLLILFTLGLNAQLIVPVTDDEVEVANSGEENSIPLFSNCENGSTKRGRLGCIRNKMNALTQYINTDEILGKDPDKRVRVRLEFEVLQTRELSLLNVVNDDSKVREIMTKAFEIWKRRNEGIVIKPAQKDGENISFPVSIVYVFLGDNYL